MCSQGLSKKYAAQGSDEALCNVTVLIRLGQERKVHLACGCPLSWRGDSLYKGHLGMPNLPFSIHSLRAVAQVSSNTGCNGYIDCSTTGSMEKSCWRAHGILNNVLSLISRRKPTDGAQHHFESGTMVDCGLQMINYTSIEPFLKTRSWVKVTDEGGSYGHSLVKLSAFSACSLLRPGQVTPFLGSARSPQSQVRFRTSFKPLEPLCVLLMYFSSLLCCSCAIRLSLSMPPWSVRAFVSIERSVERFVASLSLSQT